MFIWVFLGTRQVAAKLVPKRQIRGDYLGVGDSSLWFAPPARWGLPKNVGNQHITSGFVSSGGIGSYERLFN